MFREQEGNGQSPKSPKVSLTDSQLNKIFLPKIPYEKGELSKSQLNSFEVDETYVCRNKISTIQPYKLKKCQLKTYEKCNEKIP